MEKSNEEQKIKQLNEKQKTVIYFFIYAILGWILETVFCLVVKGQFDKRGFLYGPLCPMYGFAAILMIEFLKKIKTTNTIEKFFICMISFAAFEYVVAVVLEALFGLRWWDYSDEKFNFQGRISLPYSIAWGIIGTIFVEKIHPFVVSEVQAISEKINKKIQLVFIYIFVIIITVDFVLSVIKYINLK